MKINDPRTNLRECVKQLCLLESHLLEVGKFCPDCIAKHLFTLEALAEEGQALDTNRGLCQTFEALEDYALRWSEMFTSKVPTSVIGQEVRKVRKALAQHALDPECRKLVLKDVRVAAYGDASDLVSADLKSAKGLAVVALGAIALWYWYDKQHVRS